MIIHAILAVYYRNSGEPPETMEDEIQPGVRWWSTVKGLGLGRANQIFDQVVSGSPSKLVLQMTWYRVVYLARSGQYWVVVEVVLHVCLDLGPT